MNPLRPASHLVSSELIFVFLWCLEVWIPSQYHGNPMFINADDDSSNKRGKMYARNSETTEGWWSKAVSETVTHKYTDWNIIKFGTLLFSLVSEYHHWGNTKIPVERMARKGHITMPLLTNNARLESQLFWSLESFLSCLFFAIHWQN